MVCIDCGDALPGAHPLTKRCAGCRRKKASAKTRAYQKAHADAVNAKNRAWRAANPAKAYEYEKAKKAKDPDRYRAYYRKRARAKSGVLNPTSETKSGACYNAGCTYTGPLVFDHHHTGPKAGQFRGWLCDPCNIGRFGEDRAKLLGIVEYYDLADGVDWPEETT